MLPFCPNPRETNTWDHRPGLCQTCRMGELARDTGKKALALGVLLLAAWVLFKVVLGFVTAVAWIVVVVLALAAIVWALRVL